MRHKLFATLAASLLLSLGSSSTLAIGFCDRFPGAPICAGEGLPILEEDPSGPINFSIAVGGTARIDFGAVDVGDSSTTSVTVTNTTGSPFGPINIFSGAPATAEFNASQNCQGVTLPAQGTCSITYAFSPGAPGVFSDTSNFTISATNNQADGASFSVALSGAGVEPGDEGSTGPCTTPTSCLPDFPNEAALTGSARVKGAGFKSTEALALQVHFDDATFLAIDGDKVYFGNLVPKGPSGTKFRLFLDAASADSFSADVAARAAATSGLAAGSVLGESSELVLKLKNDGRASLKIKSNVLVTGIGEVVFKATLVGGLVAQ
jgi:Abnormal spindle-like microcephaly-assoc'd, ASPM-SPD-2-Hydin